MLSRRPISYHLQARWYLQVRRPSRFGLERRFLKVQILFNVCFVTLVACSSI